MGVSAARSRCRSRGGTSQKARNGSTCIARGAPRLKARRSSRGKRRHVAAPRGLGAEVDQAEAAVGTPGDQAAHAVEPGQHLPPIEPAAERVGLVLVQHHQGVRQHQQRRAGLLGGAQQQRRVLLLPVRAEAGAGEQGGGQQDAGGADMGLAAERRAAVEQILVHRHPAVVQAARPQLDAARGVHAGAAGHHHVARPGGGQLAFQLLRQPLVVIVQERDPAPRRAGRAPVARRPGAARLGQLQHAHPAVRPTGEGVRGRRVRAVDHDHGLQGRVGLRQHAAQGAGGRGAAAGRWG